MNQSLAILQLRELNVRNTSREGRKSPRVLEVTGGGADEIWNTEVLPCFYFLDSPVLIQESDLDLLHRRLLEKEGRRLVMVILPEAGGPPVTIGVGHLLPGGEVSLDPGMEVTGIYWENMDRIIHTNGSILYKVTGAVEEGEVTFGTLGRAGAVTPLPQLGNISLDLQTLRFLNINKPWSGAGK